MHLDLTAAADRLGRPSQHRLHPARACHVDRDRRALCGELAGRGHERVEVLPHFQRTGIDALQWHGRLADRAEQRHMVYEWRRRRELLRVGAEIADVRRRARGDFAVQGVGIGVRGERHGVCRVDDGPAGGPHLPQKQRGHEPAEERRAGHEPLECLGPEILHVHHERRVEAACESVGGGGALQRRQACEDDVGPLHLAGGNRLVGEPFKVFAEVAVAAAPGQRDVFFIGPHRHQPHAEVLVLADVAGERPDCLAAVAPRAGPPGHVVAAACEHAGQRPIPHRRQVFARDVVERIDDPDREGQGERLGSGSGHRRIVRAARAS